MDEVRMTITHRCFVRGERVEPGTEIAVALHDAQALLDAGRALLADQSDGPALQAALAEAFQRVAQAQPLFGQSPEGAAEAVRELEQIGRPRGIGFVLND